MTWFWGRWQGTSYSSLPAAPCGGAATPDDLVRGALARRWPQEPAWARTHAQWPPNTNHHHCTPSQEAATLPRRSTTCTHAQGRHLPPQRPLWFVISLMPLQIYDMYAPKATTSYFSGRFAAAAAAAGSKPPPPKADPDAGKAEVSVAGMAMAEASAAGMHGHMAMTGAACTLDVHAHARVLGRGGEGGWGSSARAPRHSTQCLPPTSRPQVITGFEGCLPQFSDPSVSPAYLPGKSNPYHSGKVGWGCGVGPYRFGCRMVRVRFRVRVAAHGCRPQFPLVPAWKLPRGVKRPKATAGANGPCWSIQRLPVLLPVMVHALQPRGPTEPGWPAPPAVLPAFCSALQSGTL